MYISYLNKFLHLSNFISNANEREIIICIALDNLFNIYSYDNTILIEQHINTIQHRERFL